MAALRGANRLMQCVLTMITKLLKPAPDLAWSIHHQTLLILPSTIARVYLPRQPLKPVTAVPDLYGRKDGRYNAKTMVEDRVKPPQTLTYELYATK
jgi:hypothetical protein